MFPGFVFLFAIIKISTVEAASRTNSVDMGSDIDFKNFPDPERDGSSTVPNFSGTEESSLPTQYPYVWNQSQTAEDFLLQYCLEPCEESLTSPINEQCPSMECYQCDCISCHMGACCPHLLKDLTAGYGLSTGCLYGVLGVTRCPPAWTGHHVREACESGVGVYTEHEPVTDPRNHVTYRNKACATCSDVSNYTEWDLSFNCAHFQELYTVLSWEDFLLRATETHNCNATRAIPKDLTVDCREDKSHRHWYYGVIDTCNVTGEWKDYDVHVEENCLLYKALSLRVYHHETDLVFGNLFCALCNGITPAWTTECESVDYLEDTEDSALESERGSGYPPLSLLFDLKDSDQGVENLGVLRCEGHSVWQALNNECRNLTCTPGKVIVNGTCSTALTQISGLMYSLNLTLIPSSDIVIPASELEDAKWNISMQLDQCVRRKLEPTASRCMLTATVMFQETSSVGLVRVKRVAISGDLTASRNIPRDEAEGALVENIFSDWEITIQERNSTLRYVPAIQTDPAASSADAIAEPAQNETFVPINIFDPNDFTSMTIPPELHVPLSPLLMCPYLELSPLEYKIRAKREDRSASEVTLKFGEEEATLSELQKAVLDEDTLKVCLETLESLPRREPKEPPLSWQYILSMVIIPLSILCLVLTLIVYALLPVLRTQPGLNTMGTCCALLVAQVTLLLASHRVTSGDGCVVLGMVVHLAWLSMFCWTTVCSTHMFHVFSAKTYRGSTSRPYVKLARNIVITIFLPAVGVGLVVGVTYLSSGGTSIGYSSVRCYLDSALLVGVAMVLPVSIILLINLGLFVLTARRIHQVTKMQPRAESEGESRQHVHVCARLSVLTGATWILSLIAEGADIDWLRAITILTNGGQGILLFLSYVTTHRVIALLGVKFGLREKGVSSARTQTTSDRHSNHHRHDNHI